MRHFASPPSLLLTCLAVALSASGAACGDDGGSSASTTGGDTETSATSAGSGESATASGGATATSGTSSGTTGGGSGTSATASGTGATTSATGATTSPTGGTGTSGDTATGTTGGDPFEGLDSWFIQAQNFPILPLETYYACFELTVPTAALTHIVGFRPRIDNIPYVHHFVLMKGDGPSGNPQGYPCFDLAGEIMWAWAPGQGDYELPIEAGYLVGDDPSGETTFILQVHYNNPLQGGGQQDSSGLELFHTTDLRANNAGSIVFADVGGIRIPPGMPDYKHVADCSAAETQQGLTGEITVFGSFLHAHNIGKTLWAEQWRDGSLLREMNRDEPFNFGNQNYKSVGPYDVRPGDVLQTHCVYDSTDRTTPTNGGVGTLDEMCWHEVMYYPRENARFDYCGN